ncbi:hypothetical protein B0H17DRAFT_1151520 [Mycena rosella]|uniref:Uncharacterized protein n=1 Tax=Mycena rosella TaxID=1033263 RepID=A0AAD7BJN7_MYCRO|nr:hypothetical protein B0H17DRAFT_1151520 [Mycena rosella]
MPLTRLSRCLCSICLESHFLGPHSQAFWGATIAHGRGYAARADAKRIFALFQHRPAGFLVHGLIGSRPYAELEPIHRPFCQVPRAASGHLPRMAGGAPASKACFFAKFPPCASVQAEAEAAERPTDARCPIRHVSTVSRSKSAFARELHALRLRGSPAAIGRESAYFAGDSLHYWRSSWDEASARLLCFPRGDLARWSGSRISDSARTDMRQQRWARQRRTREQGGGCISVGGLCSFYDGTTSSYQLLRRFYGVLRQLYELLQASTLLLRRSTTCSSSYKPLRTAMDRYQLLPRLHGCCPSWLPATTAMLRGCYRAGYQLLPPCYAVATQAGYPGASSRLPAATACYALAMAHYRRGTQATILPSYRSLWSAPERPVG